MKVICIDDSGREISAASGEWFIKEGETYTVSGSFKSLCGVYCYTLAEDPTAPCYGYDANRFIPLSTIDETEMIRNYQTEKV